MHCLLTRILGRTPALARTDVPRAEAADDEPAAPGCGWFDSSHELHQGLWVREHVSPDELASELPLDFWVELHLSKGRAWPAA